MSHEVFRILKFEKIDTYVLSITFDDKTTQIIDFSPILAGSLYGPLKDPGLFAQVEIDPERHTLVWPNGADFDPETLHNWPDYLEKLTLMAKRWAAADSRAA